jgi:ferredoxin
VNYKKIKLPLAVFILVLFVLTIIQLKVEMNLLLLERLFHYGGWVETFVVSLYGAIIAWFMQDMRKASKWRMISWTVFSIWFFTQLFFGIVISDTFLLTGKLHLPVPAMIIGGPIYRQQLSVMTILFLSTIILTGPAWCSHLCYFGAIDNQFAKKGWAKPKKINNRQKVKRTILLLVISFALLLRLFNVSPLTAAISGLLFGVVGLLVIILISKKYGKMVHCIMYCPVGTVVNYFRFVNPFRMYIDKSCTTCMACSSVCKYDALNFEDVKNRKPGITCTFCGDCLTSCHAGSIKYKLFSLSPEKSREVYLFITISIHAIFLALGRI